MRIHTIDRVTGQVRVWQVPVSFVTYEGNAFDTEGGGMQGGCMLGGSMLIKCGMRLPR